MQKKQFVKMVKFVASNVKVYNDTLNGYLDVTKKSCLDLVKDLSDDSIVKCRMKDGTIYLNESEPATETQAA